MAQEIKFSPRAMNVIELVNELNRLKDAKRRQEARDGWGTDEPTPEMSEIMKEINLVETWSGRLESSHYQRQIETSRYLLAHKFENEINDMPLETVLAISNLMGLSIPQV